MVDTTPPTITSVTPTDGSASVVAGTAITAVFSESMVTGTINATNFTLVTGSTAVPGNAVYTDNNKTATFTPNTTLTPGARYTATVTTGVTDLAGNHLANPMTWSFTFAATQAVVINVSVPSPAKAGSDFVVQINVGQVTNLNVYGIELDYNNAVIQVSGAEGGKGVGVTDGQVGSTAIPVDLWGFYPAGTPGKIRIAGRVPQNGVATGTGYLCQVHFTAAAGAAGQSSPLTLLTAQGGGATGSVLYDNTSKVIPSALNSGSVTIQ